MNINEFKKQKKNPEYLNLDEQVLENLLNIFDKKVKKISIKNKSNNILKNIKTQHSKELLTNKVNLILNKLSESNLNNLIIEFIELINYLDENDYFELLKIFYIKIISEINFIDIYLIFFRNIIYLYNKILNYSFEEFINIIEIKFKIDYLLLDINPTNKFFFLIKINDEQKRINNLILIKKLVELNFLSENIFVNCSNIILNQNKYIIDIYKWFEITNIKLNDNYLLKISEILKYNNILIRDKILLQTLYNNNIITDIFKLECYNIINEDINNIIIFIKNNCTDAIQKNKFCNNLFSYYILYKNDNCFNILDQLFKNKIIFKSNIHKGYQLLNKNDENIILYLTNNNII